MINFFKSYKILIKNIYPRRCKVTYRFIILRPRLKEKCFQF